MPNVPDTWPPLWQEVPACKALQSVNTNVDDALCCRPLVCCGPHRAVPCCAVLCVVQVREEPPTIQLLFDHKNTDQDQGEAARGPGDGMGWDLVALACWWWCD